MNIPSILTRHVAILLGFVFFISPLSASAQASPYGNRTDTDSALAEGAYYPPALYVTSTKLSSASVTNEIKGSFHIVNQSDDILGDIMYRVDIMSPLTAGDGSSPVVADTPIYYSQTLGAERVAIIPKEERDISFSQVIPALPSGTYRLRIQMLTAQGKELGWNDTPFTITSDTTAFAELIHGPIQLPEFKNEIIAPTSGANVSPSGKFTVTAEAENKTGVALQAIPTLDMYAFGLSGEKISTQTGAAVTIAPNTTQTISLPVTAAEKPGTYYAVLTLKTEAGLQVSSLADYRWTVRGESGRIISARIAKLATKQGESITVHVDYAGSADAETTTKANMTISVLDESGVAGTFTVPEELNLTDAVESGIANIPLTRDLSATPGLEITLRDAEGIVLHPYTSNIPLTEQQKNMVTKAPFYAISPLAPRTTSLVSDNTLIIILAILLVLLVGGYAIWKKRSLSSRVSPLILLLILGASALTIPLLAHAGIRVVTPQIGNTIDSGWTRLNKGYIVEIFVNRPIHESTYQKNNVPLDFRVMYGASNSGVAYTKNFFRYAQSHIGTYQGAWTDLGTTDLTSGENPCAGGNNKKCYTIQSYATLPDLGLDFSGLPPSATSATLQLISKWGFTAAPSDVLPENPEDFSGFADGINTWLNFPAGTPAPATPTPLICAGNPKMNIDFIEVSEKERRKPNEHPTEAVSYFGNGEIAGDAVPVDLVRNGQPVIDGVLPFNVNGLAVQRGNGFITIQLYSKGSTNRGKECVIADVNLENATFTGFQNGGGKWKNRLDRPTNGKWRFCRGGGKDEVWVGIGTGTAEFISASGPGNDTFTLYYDYLANPPAGTPTCAPTATPTPTVTVTPTPTPVPGNNPPIGVATIRKGSEAASSNITVTRGEPVQISLHATGSSDPDGWNNSTLGVSNGGKCEWNSDLNQGVPTFERTVSSPNNPDDCNITLGETTFHDAPGTYTYNLLRITDAAGGVSNNGSVTVTVVAPAAGDFQCNNTIDDDDPEDALIDANDPGCHTDGNANNPDSYDPTDDDERNTATPTPTFNPGDFEETR